MYQEFFGLSERPFPPAARVDRYYPSASIEQARQTLSRSIERGDGFGIVVGPSGSGKSLLAEVLAEQFRREFKVALLSNGRLCSPRALLQAILYELRLPYRDMSEGELRLSLIDHLEPSSDCPNGMLLIVDEAHSLPLRLFEEIRMITNLVRHGVPRVRLVLIGNGRLEERLAEPRLDSFSQRVISRCYLETMHRDETVQFIRAQYAAAGGDPDRVFDEAALVAVHRATDGIPRLVSQLCDHALILARTTGATQIDAAKIEEAWADLQQLPTPWNASTEVAESPEATIEFGSLDDAEDTPVADVEEVEPEAEIVEEAQPVDALPFVTRFDGAQHQQAEISHPVEHVRLEDDIDRAARHLDHLDQQIAQLNTESNLDTTEVEQEFQPLGSFQQEVELEVASLPDMFNESYDEEEVVIDRYAAMAGSLAGRPQVYSTEGAAIASALAPHDVDPPSPRLATVEEPELADVQPEVEIQFDDPPAEEFTAIETSTANVYMPPEPSEPAAYPEPVAEQEPVVEQAPPAETPIVVIEEDDDEAIAEPAIEQPAEAAVESEPPVEIVEPTEFGQLFTNLRRNTGS